MEYCAVDEARGFLNFEPLRASSLPTYAAKSWSSYPLTDHIACHWFGVSKISRPQGLNVQDVCIIPGRYLKSWATVQSQPRKDSGVTTMRLPSVLYLLPSIVPRPQSQAPTPAENVESFAGLLPPSPVALGLPQLTPNPVLTRFPTRAVSSDSAFDTPALPGSAVSSALDSQNGVTSRTFHLREATPDPSGVCKGLIEDLDITGLGERQPPSRYTNFVLQGVYRCPNNVLRDEYPHRSDSWTSPYVSESLD